MSNWSVVSTVKAPTDLINIFVQYYLSKGAKNIYLYLDSGADLEIKNMIEELFQSEKVFVQLCDEQYWSVDYKFNNLKFEGRPEAVESRQKHNTMHALKWCSTKWLLSVDVDEFLFSEENINDYLATIPDNIFSLRIKPYEAIYLETPPESMEEVFTTKYFKHREKRIEPFFWNNIYPEHYPQQDGLFGHRIGKAFIRTNEAVKHPALHNFYPVDGSLKGMFYTYRLKLLHFESLTKDFFIEKTINRINKVYNTPLLGKVELSRLENLQNLYEKFGKDGLEQAYNEMYVLNRESISQAISLQLIEEINLNQKEKKLIYRIQNIHRAFLVYNFDTEEVQCLNKENISQSNNIKYIQLLFDAEQNQCIFYTGKDNQYFYFYLNKFDRLMTYKTSRAMFFNFHCLDKISLQFAFGINEKYFTSTPSGELKLAATEIKDWEKFSLLKIEEV